MLFYKVHQIEFRKQLNSFFSKHIHLRQFYKNALILEEEKGALFGFLL